MEAESMAVVVGRNARGIRLAAGLTLERTAQAAKSFGLHWSSGKVGDFESGRVSPTMPTLIAVVGVLGDVTGHPVSLVDLFNGDGRVEITNRVSIAVADVRHALRGGEIQFTPSDVEGRPEELKSRFQQLRRLKVDVDRQALQSVLADYSESDRRIAKAFGLEEFTAAAYMANLWGRPFHIERDERAGSDANAQAKGRIARKLKAELREALDGNS